MKFNFMFKRNFVKMDFFFLSLNIWVNVSLYNEGKEVTYDSFTSNRYEFFEVLQKVLEKEMYFVIASGNQFYHLYNQFLPYSDELYFISENGSFITKGKKELYSFIMDKQDVQTIYNILKQYPEIMPVIGGKEKSYIPQQYLSFKEEIERHYDEYAFIDDIHEIKEGILKFSIHDPQHHVEKYVELIKKELPAHLKIMTSGNEWMDIQHETINKGFGIHFLMNTLHLTKEECAVFGDQMNDYELFQNVHYSYAMKNAIQPLKEIAFQVIDSNDEAGVTGKIKEILKGEL